MNRCEVDRKELLTLCYQDDCGGQMKNTKAWWKMHTYVCYFLVIVCLEFWWDWSYNIAKKNIRSKSWNKNPKLFPHSQPDNKTYLNSNTFSLVVLFNRSLPFSEVSPPISWFLLSFRLFCRQITFVRHYNWLLNYNCSFVRLVTHHFARDYRTPKAIVKMQLVK